MAPPAAAVHSIAAAKKTGVDWAQSMATMHANFVRDTSEIFFTTFSKQLKS